MEDRGDWVEIERYTHRRRAEDDALALAAVGIGSRLVGRAAELALLVSAADALRADYELGEYHRENADRQPAALRPAREALKATLAYAAVLLFIHGSAARQLFGYDWWSAGYAQAGLIASGQWWRTVTALTLHADVVHLGGNLVAGGVFGAALAQFLGPGLAWMAILVAAAIGNALNAFAHSAAHTAVGASTAVFAAVGLTSVLAWRRNAVFPARGMRRYLPLAAGTALLADLGMSGERTDLGAHAFGFIVGVALGAAILATGSRLPRGRSAQLCYGAGALSIVALVWFLAVRNL